MTRVVSTVFVMAFLLAACSSSSTAKGREQLEPTWARTTPAASCESPSQFGAAGPANEVQGTSRNASVWGLALGPGSVPPRVGDELKIVWRVTGSGPLRVTFTGPDGVDQPLVFGPERHFASSYERPGAEWGTGFRFTRAGCWHIRLTRTNTAGDVWLRVEA